MTRLASKRLAGMMWNMTASRDFLVVLLERVAEGGDLTMQELDVAIPEPIALDQAEKRGWQTLSHWADDGDIRSKDERYADFQRKRIREQLAALK
ncbi:hypothetical protein [Sphingosinicella sp.]|uniref:hypothetical protein n=1 Tax=Sphingosinicella sp. TaxID=1917971 RepID=UPI0017CB49FF|nr:hypothetical protein [Sphingosinicella sp.]MBA4759040.1 hypothetical protein [Sphingosinicella sp.]